MAFIREFRARARQIVGPVLGIVVVGYFAYHVVQGDRSILAWWHYKQELAQVKLEAEQVRKNRMTMEHRVSLLYPETLDKDMLDERVRDMLNLGEEGELVILTGRP